VVSSTPRPHFTPGKDPVPIVQEVGWAPGPVWTGGISRPHRDSIPNRPARSQSLYRLSYRAQICVYIYIYIYIYPYVYHCSLTILKNRNVSTTNYKDQDRSISSYKYLGERSDLTPPIGIKYCIFLYKI